MLSPFKSKEHNFGHHTSKTGDILSACSSHDSSSENAESKATLMAPDTSGIAMLSKAAADPTIADDQGLLEPQIFCGKRIFSDQHKQQKVSECNGDDISCVTGDDSPNMIVGDHRGDTDRKNVPCSSTSVSSSGLERFEKEVNVQPTSYCSAGSPDEIEEKHICSSRPTEFNKGSLQETAPIFDKSNPSVTSSLGDDVCAGGSALKGDLSVCSMEQVDSSLARLPTFSHNGQKHDALVSAESVKFKTELDEGDPTTKAMNCTGQNENLVMLEVSYAQEPPVHSQPVGCNDGSDLLEDVKVCDICGDAGREELLATCSRCSDGAEHIYCMRVRLDKVPEGNWMCEECMLYEGTEKQTQNKYGKLVGSSKGPALNEIHQDVGNSCTANPKTSLSSDDKDSNVDKSRRESRDKVSSIQQFPAKRLADNSESVSVVKRRALETSAESPRVSSPLRKSLLSRESSYKAVDGGKTKPTYKISSLEDHCSNNTLGKAHLLTKSVHNSPKSPHVLMSRGTLTRSNSVTILASKRKIQLSEKDTLQKQKFPRETAASEKKKDGTVRMMSKSMSFNNVSSGHSNAADLNFKMLSSKSSHVEDFKRLRHAKECNSIERKHTGKLDNTLGSLTMASSCPLKNDGKIESHAETLLRHPSGTYHDLKAVQRHGNSQNSSKPARHLVHKSSKNPNHLDKSGVVKRMCTSGDPSSHAISDSYQEMKPSLVVLKDDLASSSLLSSGCHCGNSDSIAKDISPQSRESSSGGEKVKETSDFSKPGQHVSAGSGSVCCHKCKNMGHAAESCPMISTRAPILDAGTSKEVDRSSRTDLRPMFCNQPDEFRIFSVPKLDYIWKGEFEIQSSGRLPSFCYGIQAHLSTCSSPKVPEEVKKFPHKILLEEVPRLSTWPTQFLGNHLKEDSIGLYFFAEDLESYGRNYKSMLECMINYDLALIGKFDGIELLIFSSNVLPENSQCWNKLFFLWGVFRERKVNNVECLGSQNKTSNPSLNDVPLDQNLASLGMFGSRHMYSSGKPSEFLSTAKLLYNVERSSTYIDPLELPSVSSTRKDGNRKLILHSSEQKCFSSEANYIHQPSRDDGVLLSRIPMEAEQLCSDVQQTNTFLKEHEVTERKQGVSASQGPVGGMSEVMSSKSQVMASDYKDQLGFEFLDLQLSLGAGKNLTTQRLRPSFLGIVEEKHNQDKVPSSVASKKNNDGGEFPVSLDLSLTLPSHDK
ncbi:ASI1-immunoprecipitated protein 2-like isoform X2 [Cornus florida]|nr:ASI1-immunoprecipitated protein 2-like isoform X2 [Cornus florida]